MADRVVVITGVERRRRWTDEERLALLAEAFAPGAIVEHVARRHGVATSCLYGWRQRYGFSRAGIRSKAEPPPDAYIRSNLKANLLFLEGMKDYDAQPRPPRPERAAYLKRRDPLVTQPEGIGR